MKGIKFNETSYNEIIRHIDNDMHVEEWKRNLYKINIVSKFAVEGAITSEQAYDTIRNALPKL